MNKFGVFTLTALGTLGVVAGGTAIALSTPQVQDKLKDHYSETIVVEVPGQTEPEEPTININLADYEFTLDEESKTATITKYNGTDANLVLPSTFSVTEEGEYIAGEDYVVTSIDSSVFDSNAYIESVVIPNNVISIGNTAFQSCPSLRYVYIPSSITNIGSSVFSNCSALRNVILEDGLTVLGERMFASCRSLISIEIPSSIKELPSNLFNYCSNLQTVVLNEGLEEFGPSVFSYCLCLKSIVIPNSVTTIGSSVFSNCTSLESIIIPNSVAAVGSSAFSGCISLKSVQLSTSMTTFNSNSFSKCSSLESITIPSNFTLISSCNGTFANCNNLKTLIIESGDVFSQLTDTRSTYCAGLLSNDPTTIKVLASIIDEEERTNSLLDNPENYTRTLDDDGVYYTYTKVVNEETV